MHIRALSIGKERGVTHITKEEQNANISNENPDIRAIRTINTTKTMNQSIKLDLLKLKGAAVVNLKGKTATKRCLVIPIEDAQLFLGQKGCYLNLTAIEMQNSQYGNTHCVKQSYDRSVYDAMTEEERNAQPIIGSVRPLMKQAPAIEASNIVANEDDLPF